jgi:nuclease S1
MLPHAMAWGPVGHAVIGEVVEVSLLRQDRGLQDLLARFREPQHNRPVRQALLNTILPSSGETLRVLANWPDAHKREPGMLPHDAQRHYINLPHEMLYDRSRHCPDGSCSIETLLEQRAILADRRASLSKRAVALAWVIHLVGDMHQPLHAGKAENRGGNLTCIAWLGEPSRLVTVNGETRCSGENLHALWDGTIIEVITGFTHPDKAPAFAQQLQPYLKLVQASEPPLTAQTRAEWRIVVERWHSETQALILLGDVYPRGSNIGHRYAQSHYRTVRLQLLRAAVRLAAMLHLTLR